MPSKRRLSSLLENKGYLNQSHRLSDGTYIQSEHISSARLALAVDRDALYKNALIAYAGMFRLISSNSYSWAVIHSYYSIVFFYQVLLAFNDISLCYDQGKPFAIKLTSRAQFKKKDGNTHKSILSMFKEEFGADSEICSEIEGVCVCDWFENIRNDVNYRTVPQDDPRVICGLCDYKERNGLRKKIMAYLNELDMYAYAPEHAYVAYPLLLIRRITEQYEKAGQRSGCLGDMEFVKHLKDNICDNTGVLTQVLELIGHECN
jgi:hypothetical protein